MRALIAACAGCLVVAFTGSSVFAQAAHGGEPQPAAEDVDAARTHFKLGIDSYRDSDLPTALIEFKRAYAASPNYRLLYNLGQVCQELRDYPEAERYFKQYLRDGASEIDTARKQQVETELAKVKLRIASLVLSTNFEDAEWFVDDVASGRAPLADVVRVSAGRHRVTAAISGRQRVTKIVDAAGGETVVVDVNFPLQPVNLTVAPEPAKRPQHPEPAGSNAALYMLIGTGAVAAGAGVLGYLAYQDSQDYKEALGHKTTEAALDKLAGAARTKAIVTDVLLGAAAVGAGITLYLALDGTDHGAAEHASLQVGPTSLQMTKHF